MPIQLPQRIAAGRIRVSMRLRVLIDASSRFLSFDPPGKILLDIPDSASDPDGWNLPVLCQSEERPLRNAKQFGSLADREQCSERAAVKSRIIHRRPFHSGE